MKDTYINSKVTPFMVHIVNALVANISTVSTKKHPT